MPGILLTGKNGQIGHELRRSLAPLGAVTAWGREDADFTDLSALEAAIRRQAPDILINAAAYTAVDRAEVDATAAYRVNAEAVDVLARTAARSGAWLVHYSTDYVFDGNSREPYRENDSVAPLNVYGASKLAGEDAVRNSRCRHLIFRTCWVYGRGGGSFMPAILKRARESYYLEVVMDQTGAPTGADIISEITTLCLRRILADPALAGTASGTYHLAASGRTTRHGYARFLLEEAIRMGAEMKATPERVIPVPGRAYVTAAKRPSNSLLDTAKLSAIFDVTLPDWKVGVRRLLPALLGPQL